jgi:hypothetical protein
MFEMAMIGSIKTLLDIIVLIKEKMIPGKSRHTQNFDLST